MEPPNQNDDVSSHSLTRTLTPLPPPPPLPTLPFELIAEILCRLPVKKLLQLRKEKPFKSLISNPKFAKKHLRFSVTRRRLIVSSSNNLNEFQFFDSPIPSVFTNSTLPQTILNYPNTLSDPFTICSCDGILCITSINLCAILWNPSIDTFKTLPPLEKVSSKQIHHFSLYSFGFDHFNDNYKVIVVTPCINQNEVSVLTMGTDYWRRIRDFPYSGPIHGSGVFVSGTVSWLVGDASSSSRKIISLDLEKEVYQNISKPDLNNDIWTLSMLNDLLCIFASTDMVLDVWVMKEYGKKESWTKLYNLRYMEDDRLSALTRAIYISKDDQLLMSYLDSENNKLKLFVYDSRSGTYKIPEILEVENINRWLNPEVYIESLISPC